jgi:hypothetical protein
MTLDTRARATASRLLNKYGKAVVFNSIIKGSYDTTTGSIASDSVTSINVKASIRDFNGIDIMSGVVQAGDRKVTMPAIDLSVTPKPSDTITFDGDTYTVIEVHNTWSGELPAVYTLQVRK